mmetsp:Transcript_95267/g.308544  ORF Transcript_95267/g.308544 Transcript_95267/m.308544 type:complete len:273 (-) Transcript_95267:322-1140(-)
MARIFSTTICCRTPHTSEDLEGRLATGGSGSATLEACMRRFVMPWSSSTISGRICPSSQLELIPLRMLEPIFDSGPWLRKVLLSATKAAPISARTTASWPFRKAAPAGTAPSRARLTSAPASSKASTTCKCPPSAAGNSAGPPMTASAPASGSARISKRRLLTVAKSPCPAAKTSFLAVSGELSRSPALCAFGVTGLGKPSPGLPSGGAALVCDAPSVGNGGALCSIFASACSGVETGHVGGGTSGGGASGGGTSGGGGGLPPSQWPMYSPR